MKLYRQTQLPNGDTALALLGEHESLQELRARARQIAISEGIVDIQWLSGSDAGGTIQFPHELHLTDTASLIIRNW